MACLHETHLPEVSEMHLLWNAFTSRKRVSCKHGFLKSKNQIIVYSILNLSSAHPCRIDLMSLQNCLWSEHFLTLAGSLLNRREAWSWKVSAIKGISSCRLLLDLRVLPCFRSFGQCGSRRALWASLSMFSSRCSFIGSNFRLRISCIVPKLAVAFFESLKSLDQEIVEQIDPICGGCILSSYFLAWDNCMNTFLTLSSHFKCWLIWVLTE